MTEGLTETGDENDHRIRGMTLVPHLLLSPRLEALLPASIEPRHAVPEMKGRERDTSVAAPIGYCGQAAAV